MKAVLLAAGKGTRTYPLTLLRPKPLLKIANKTLIEHNLEQLVELVDEVLIIIGYKGDLIKRHLGNNYHGLKLRYIEQKKQLGTGHAVLQAERFLCGERFIVMMSDDLYFRNDIRRCLRYEFSVLAKRVTNYQDFGVFVKKGDHVYDIVEKPKTFVSDLANAGLYVFDDKIFTEIRKAKKSIRGEYELTDALKQISKVGNVFCVEANVWIPIGYPWNLIEADQIVRDKNVLTGKKNIINGKLLNCTIGDNCRIDGFVKNSIIGDHVTIYKDSVIEDSIIGNHVKFRGTIKTSENVEVMMNAKRITIENFGAAIADNTELLDVFLLPGTLVWPGIKKKGVELSGNVK